MDDMVQQVARYDELVKQYQTLDQQIDKLLHDHQGHEEQEVEGQPHERQRQRRGGLPEVEVGGQGVAVPDQEAAVLGGDAGIAAEDGPPVHAPVVLVHPVQDGDRQGIDDREDEKPLQGLSDGVSEWLTHGPPPFLPPVDADRPAHTAYEYDRRPLIPL